MSRITTLLLVFCLILSGCGKHKSRNNQVTSEPDSLSGPHSHAQELFDKARELQKGEDYPAAISVYQQLISLEPTDDDIKSVATLMDEGFLQLVYCYIFGGQRKDGADYFSHIYKENKLWFVRNYPRSVEISTAYSLYEATRLEEAVALIDRALSRQEEGRENEQLYVDNGIASVIYNQAGEIRKAIACGERSLEIIKTLEDQSKIVFVLGNLIFQYQQVGEFEQALAAYDALLASGEGEKNPYGLCAAETNVVQLYDEWGLEEEVMLHLDKAREAADRSSVPDAFLRVDNLSVYYALQCKEYEKAAVLLDSMQVRMPDRSQNSFYHEFYDNYTCILAVSETKGQGGMAIASALQLIGQLKDRPLNNLSVLTYRLLGDVLAEVGETALSIEAYQACCDYIEKNQLVNQQRLVYYALGKLYAETMRPAESSRYLLMAHQANQQFTERRNAGLISQFRIKYETREKEQDNRLLRSELQLQKRTLQYYILIGILSFLLGVAFLLWLSMRHKKSLRLIEEKEGQLRQMLTERQNLNRKNEELRMQIETADALHTMQEVINSLSPRLLTAEEEQEFRRQFCLLYPSFLSGLRKACSAVTRNDELLAMLIRLNLSSEEIAFALGNNRASVNTSRFRLRKKLELDKDVSLEDYMSRF